MIGKSDSKQPTELAKGLAVLPERNAELQKEEAELAMLLSTLIGSPKVAPTIERLKELARNRIADLENARIRRKRAAMIVAIVTACLIVVSGVLLIAFW